MDIARIFFFRDFAIADRVFEVLARRVELVSRLAIRNASAGDAASTVADTGPGIDDAIKAKLFEPFVTSKAWGMGVGLSLCRSIIEAHGGLLWAEDSPNGGAVFRFTGPAAEV